MPSSKGTKYYLVQQLNTLYLIKLFMTFPKGIWVLCNLKRRRIVHDTAAVCILI